MLTDEEMVFMVDDGGERPVQVCGVGYIGCSCSLLCVLPAFVTLGFADTKSSVVVSCGVCKFVMYVGVLCVCNNKRFIALTTGHKQKYRNTYNTDIKAIRRGGWLLACRVWGGSSLTGPHLKPFLTNTVSCSLHTLFLH